MSPRTATFFPRDRMPASVWSAATAESGLALYVSFMMVTPFTCVTSILFATGRNSPSARRMFGADTLKAIPTAAAASAFWAAWAPAVASCTEMPRARRGLTRNDAHADSSSETASPRTMQDGVRNPYVTRCRTPAAARTTCRSSAFTNAFPLLRDARKR
jgi:hypothetical protein